MHPLNGIDGGGGFGPGFRGCVYQEGHQGTEASGGATTTCTYNAIGQLLSESRIGFAAFWKAHPASSSFGQVLQWNLE